MSAALPIGPAARLAGPYVASVGQTAFTFAFAAIDPGDVLVETATAEFPEGWVPASLGTDYTLPDSYPVLTGGTVLFVAGRAGGTRVRIIGRAAIASTTDVMPAGKVDSVLLNRFFDRVTIWAQELREQADRVAQKLGLIDGAVAEAAAAAAMAFAEEADASAQTAADNRDLTAAQAATATSARVSAEAARDAAFNSAPVYVSTAAGLAATSSGQQFRVVSGATIQAYTNSSGVAVAISGAAYPTVAGTVTRDIGKQAARGSLAADYATDTISPLWVEPYTLVNASPAPTAANALVATIASRDSDTQMTLASGHGVRLAALGTVIVKDDASGLHMPYRVKAIAGDVVTLLGGVLPATITTCMSLHDDAFGQHLSRYGYTAYGEYLASLSERRLYRKAHPALAYFGAFHTATGSGLGADIYNYANTAVAIPVTRLGTAASGGYIPGSSISVKFCGQAQSDRNFAFATYGGFLFATRCYTLQDATAGNGYSIPFSLGGCEGVLTYQLGVSNATTGNEEATGSVTVEVVVDGVTVSSQTLEPGFYNNSVSLPAGYDGAFRVTLAASVFTTAHLGALRVDQKSSRTTTAVPFRSGDRVAFLMDSWGVYPAAAVGETALLTPDGAATSGMQFISERFRERLAAQGIDVVTRNWSKGGMTSAWARYWVEKIIEDRADWCFVGFGINDANSNGNVAGHTASAYDFSPTDMWALQLSNAGGVFGSVNYSQYADNIAYICRRLIAGGVRPIVLAPPIVASVGQAQGLLANLYTRIAGGSEPLFAQSGRS